MKPVSCMIYNANFDVAICADCGGMMEYWRGLKRWVRNQFLQRSLVRISF